jgi:hypothetical protein
VTGAVIDEGATNVGPIDTFGMGGTEADDAGGAVGGAGNDDDGANDDADDDDGSGATGGIDTTAGGATVAVVGGGAGNDDGMAAGLGRASRAGGARGPGRRRMDGGCVGAATGTAAANGRPHSRHVVAVPGFLAPQVGQNIVVGLVRCAAALKSDLPPACPRQRSWRNAP